MTVIVALRQKNKIVLGGDRRVTGGPKENIRLTMARPKVWSTNGYLFGFCGTMEGEHLQAKFVPPKPSGDIDAFMQDTFLSSLATFYEKWDVYKDRDNDMGMGLLICVDQYIYEHDPAFMTMSRYEGDYFSIGSGSQYALGSLYSTTHVSNPKKRVEMAIEAACTFTPTCGLPSDTVSLTIKAPK